jgi:PKD repeat protein
VTKLKLIAILFCCAQTLLFHGQDHRVSPLYYEQHAREHLISAGYTGSTLDSMLEASQRERLERMNAKPVYHPFGDDRDLRKSMPVFDCDNDNWGFEEGDLSGWSTEGSLYMTDSGVDPYGNYPWVYPSGGNYSVKMMSDDSYADYARLSRSIDVPPTGTTYFSFHFAMSILNMEHTSDVASRFQVRFYSGSGAELPCPTFTCFYSTDLGPQGVDSFNQTPNEAYFYNPSAADGVFPVTYSDWTDVTLDLSGYAGQTLTVEFSSSYCEPGPHWCYALVDVDCPINTSVPQLQCSFPPFYPACGPEGMASYEWTNGSGQVLGSNQCIDVMAAGNYFCTFLPQDVQCTAGSEVTVEYVVGPYPEAITSVDPNGCVNEGLTFTNNSTVDVGIIDGYLWDFDDGNQSNAATPNHSFSTAGQYDVSMIVYSDLGCKDTSNHVVTVIPSPLVDFDWTTACMLPEANMTDLSQASGSPITTRAWDISADATVESTAANPTLSFAAPGTYPVKLTVTDGNNCSAEKTKSVLIYELVELDVETQSDFNGYSIDCFGASSGSIALDANGGDGGYSFVDFDGSLSSSNLTGLSAGNYTLIAEDGRGCRDTIEVELTQPLELTVTAENITDYNGFPVSCAASADGQSVALPAGGVAPFQYEWTTGIADDTSNVDLPGGPNYVLVTDANGCEQLYQFNLAAPTELGIAVEGQSDYNGFNVSCFGSEDGWINLEGTGGVGGYTFTGATEATAGIYEELNAGVQTFEMLDANGCITSIDVNFSEPASIECNTTVLSNYNGYNVSCYEYNDAIAWSQPTGGVAPFAHTWSNGGNQIMNDSLSALDNWLVLVDDNNCERTCEFLITQPQPLEALVNNIPDTCARSVGSFITSLSGGVAPYSSYWFFEKDSTYTLGVSYSGAEAGLYDFHMMDLNGCTKDYSFEKSEVPQAIVSFVKPYRKFCTQESTKFELEADKNLLEYSWNINDRYFSTQPAPEVFFEETGQALVDVSVLDEHNCIVDTSMTITLDEGISMYIPNAITADGDGLNDVFGPVYSGVVLYRCSIVDRWGISVFESNNPDEKWLGGMQGGTHYNGNDVFNYIIEVTGECEIEKTYRGYVVLIR